MLSTETPPDPSSSTAKFLPVKVDERAPAELPFQEADPPVLQKTTTPSFCIRDYVFALRSKDISANWPFTKESLHLCLKHDIKDPLPPFEAPALVRVRCLGQITGTDQLVAQSSGEEIVAHSGLLKTRNIGLSKGHPPSIKDDSCFPSDEAVLDCADQNDNSPVDEGKSAVHPGTSLARDLRSLASILENSEPIDTAEKLCRKLEKKCRLPVKIGPISGTNRAEDIISNSGMVSDSMASKVCPVCKTFSSTSNTTLNAHIDQCLSMESNTNEVLRKIPKLNVKPRKKRLMEDIYATSSRYTLEDLDRRNGTNWAVEVALLARPATDVAPVTAIDTKTTVDSSDDKREGAVYVDSKGIKVRILSNFKNIPVPNKDFKSQWHKKNLKTRENILIEEAKHFTLKHSMDMKLKGQKRKLRSFNLQTKQILAIPGGNEKIHNQKSDQSQSELWTDQSQGKNSKSHLFCELSSSPNPDSPRKSSSNFVQRIQPRCDMLAKSNQLDISNSNSIRKHRKKLLRPPEDLTHSTRTKKTDFLCSTAQSVVHERGKTTELPVFHSRSSANGLVLRSSGNHTSCPRSKKDIPTCLSNDSSGMTLTPSENCQSLMNGQNNSTLKINESIRRPYFRLETNEADASEKLTVYNKFRKLKSNSRTARRRRKFRPPYDVEVSGISKDHGFDLGEKAKSFGSCQSAFSKCVEISDAGEIMNQLSPSQIDIQEFDEREHSNTMEGEQNSSKRCYEYQMQVGISDSRVNNIGDDIVNLNPTTASGMQLNSSSLMEGHHHTLSGNKTTVQFNQESNIQYISHGNVSSNEIVNQNTEKGDDTLVREVNDSWLELPNECLNDVVAVQQCASSLTSHGDLGLEMHSKNPLTTSVCQTETLDKSSSNEHEQSSSPVSTASTVSLPSSNDPKSNEPEVEPLKNSVTLHGKLCMAGPFSEKTQGTRGRNIDGRFLEADTLRGDEPDYIFNNKPFCCSCKESLSAESQLLRLNDTTRTAEAQQFSNLFSGQRMSSSFTTYQNKTTTVASTASESHNFGILPKNLVDSVATYPVIMDIGFPTSHSQSQPSSNSVLRLMGKNLMVVNNEEFVQPETATSDYPPTVNYLSPAFGSTNFLNQEGFPYHHQQALSGSSASFSQAMSIGDGQMHQQYIMATSGGFVGSPYSNNWVRIQGQQSEQMKSYERLDSCPAPYVMNEVIMIDDSPERETGFRGLVSPTSTLTPIASGFNTLLQRPVACLPSKSRSREVPGVPTPIRFRTYSTG